MNSYREVIQELKKEVKIPDQTRADIRRTLGSLPEQSSFSLNDERQSEKKYSHRLRFAKMAAASLAVVLVAGSTTYAAMESPILSQFSREKKEVRESAEKLVETNVEQVSTEKSEISKWVSTKVLEAVCDKNSVMVEIEAKPVEPDKYLLVPEDTEFVMDLQIPDIEESMEHETVQVYAEKLGKKCIPISLGITAKDDTDNIDWGVNYYVKKDGTAIFNINFANASKTKALDYQYGVFLSVPDDENEEKTISDHFDFTLTDQSKSEIIRYIPVVKNQKVEGTDLIVDEVTFEKSDLTITAKLKYRYVGERKDIDQWHTDYDIVFSYYDTEGQKLEYSTLDAGGGTVLIEGKEDNVYEAVDSLSPAELPQTIMVKVKDLAESDYLGTITLERVTD